MLEWNLAANSRWEPHTDRGGCNRCVGAVTIDGNQVTRNPAYYITAHAAKFVRPGSVRIASNALPTLPNVAFKTPASILLTARLTGIGDKKPAAVSPPVSQFNDLRSLPQLGLMEFVPIIQVVQVDRVGTN